MILSWRHGRQNWECGHRFFVQEENFKAMQEDLRFHYLYLLLHPSQLAVLNDRYNFAFS